MDRGAHLGLPRLCVLLAALLAIFPCCSQGHWMWLGIASIGVPEKLGCAGLPLSPRQKELCKKKPYLLPSIREGARLGLHECKRQFRHERWNCSVADNPSDASALEGALFPSLGYEMTSGTKETAFIYAVTAAGLVHSVTRTCSAGNMTECSCDASLQNSGSASEGWHWGGCSDDIQYGMLFSRRFADSPTTNSTEKETDSLALMNLHNSEAGRQELGGHGRTRQNVGRVGARLRQGLLFDPAERPSKRPSGIIRSDRESVTRGGAVEPESVSPDPSGAAIGERPWRAPGSTLEPRPRVERSTRRGRQEEAVACGGPRGRHRELGHAEGPLGTCPWPQRCWSCPADLWGCGGGGWSSGPRCTK
ncbi:hypothetical protein NDU88_001766 [Pleurodeles waltl]|uniref:Protein Wnt n=1 Tax=Pleurodeles waltl TaxID=8319 RepID=A0AAV7S8A5_PLEWA|nr:hypothetical protein NDU88_001766 [Pleurodeles waltl]